MAVAPAMAPATSLDDHARLSALIIKGRNGTLFDLSPVFQPDVGQYGAMVGANSKDVMLCFDTLMGTPAHDLASLDVFVPICLRHALPRCSTMSRATDVEVLGHLCHGVCCTDALLHMRVP